MEWNENDIEYVIRHLDTPGIMMEEEFIKWLEIDGHREFFELILNQREAFMRLEDRGKIDVETEYRRILPRITKRKNIGYWGWSAAAAVIVLAMVLLFTQYKDSNVSPEVDLAVYGGKKSAELILANGNSVQLEKNRIELREQGGIWVRNDSCSQLEYRRDSLDGGEKGGKKELVYHTLRVPAGADYVVRLSDGTRVHLNCESEFHFPVEFAKNERIVYLEGEAFFEVEKSADWPFMVVTDRMKVRVTGTRFDVKSYERENIVTITLVSGAVNVEAEGLSGDIVSLTPSYQFRLDKATGRSEVREVDVRLYTSWTDGMFVFKNQRLEEVMNVLMRWYPIEVFYLSPSVKDLKLSANLGRYENIDAIIAIIRAMDKIDVMRKGNTIVIDWK